VSWSRLISDDDGSREEYKKWILVEENIPAASCRWQSIEIRGLFVRWLDI
jgi:hypothetical protein